MPIVLVLKLLTVGYSPSATSFFREKTMQNKDAFVLSVDNK